MASLSRVVVLGIVAAVLSLPAMAQAEVISGTMTENKVQPFGPRDLQFGDGINHISPYFTLRAYFDDGEQSLYFIGADFTMDSNVGLAVGVTDILQITDASIWGLKTGHVNALDADSSPDGVGDFVTYQNIDSGYWGVCRVDDVYPVEVLPGTYEYYADVTWWFQTDGTANFAPEPGSLVLLAMGSLVVLRRRR